MNLFKRTTALLFVSLIATVTSGKEMRYDFHQLLLESEVIIDEGSINQDTFDPSIEVQVASFKESDAADFVHHKLSEDFADLALKVKITPSRSYFTVRVYGFKDSRTVAHVMDQLVKTGFSPLKIRQK